MRRLLGCLLLCALLAGNAQALTLIIDAGHGGADGGASTAEGVPESGLNLAIARRVELLASLCGTDTRMTRISEELDYPPEADSIAKKKVYDQHARAELIAGTENAVLLSIHQNNYPDPRPSGPQVFYGQAEGSRLLAERMQEALLLLCPENRRLAAPASEDIFLMRSAACPAVLAECGFLSNPEESARLQSEDYQKELAVVLLGSFLQTISQTEDLR